MFFLTSCIVRTKDFDLKISRKKCGLYSKIYGICDRNFALHYLKRSESIRVLGTDRKSIMMIRVKVKSKSELVEDREEKLALYGVICCCCDDRLLSRAVICSHTV